MCLPPVMDRQWALLVLRAVTVGPFTVRPFEGSLKGLSLGWGGGHMVTERQGGPGHYISIRIQVSSETRIKEMHKII